MPDHEQKPAAEHKAVMALISAAFDVRAGRWVHGAPTHVFAELLAALEKRGWHLVVARAPRSIPFGLYLLPPGSAAIDWPEPAEPPDTRRARRLIARGRRTVQVCVRIEPAEGHLEQLVTEFVARTSSRGVLLLPEHRALWVFYDTLAKDHLHAIDQVALRIRRIVRGIDVPAVRVSYDTRQP
jgi:hypothetical protein